MRWMALVWRIEVDRSGTGRRWLGWGRRMNAGHEVGRRGGRPGGGGLLSSDAPGLAAVLQRSPAFNIGPATSLEAVLASGGVSPAPGEQNRGGSMADPPAATWSPLTDVFTRSVAKVARTGPETVPESFSASLASPLRRRRCRLARYRPSGWRGGRLAAHRSAAAAAVGGASVNRAARSAAGPASLTMCRWRRSATWRRCWMRRVPADV